MYCFCCKLFNTKCTSKLSTVGINNWKHLGDYLKMHESSANHIQACNKWFLAAENLKNACGIDKKLREQMFQKKKHWRSVIERLMSITIFLSKNNLPFRGSSDKLMTKNNGNFLGLVEVLGQYDSSLMEHIQRAQNNEIHNHYCGKDIQNE